MFLKYVLPIPKCLITKLKSHPKATKTFDFAIESVSSTRSGTQTTLPIFITNIKEPETGQCH